MLVSSLRTTTYTYTPVTPTAVDTKKVLFKTTLPNSNSTVDGDAFVYSTQSLRDGRAAPSNAVVLQNADGSYFKIDLSTNPSSKVNMIASSGNLNLYVYNADNQSADQFTFNATGVMTNASNLDARALSAAEITNKRDLDGNGAIGAKLTKTGLTSGVLDAVGGVFKVQVKGEDLFVVGSGLNRAATINASTSTLMNANGDAWKPDETYIGYSAISAGTGAATTWDVYGRTAGGSVTKFSFGTDKKLTNTQVMSYAEMTALEATTKRDLNGDAKYGVSDITAVDAKSGLYQGKAFGQDIFLAKSATTTSAKTAALAVSTAGSFLNADGSAWAKPANLAIASMVNTGTALAPAYSVYAYKTTTVGSVVTPDKNKITRFDFVADGTTGNFKLTADTVTGVAVTAVDMAKAEKTYKRDLNTDGVFGATITATNVVGASTLTPPNSSIKTLFQASMIGKTSYVVANKLTTGVTGDLTKDLTGSLLNTDGSAWDVKTGYTVSSIVDTTTTPGSTTYDVYAYKTVADTAGAKNNIIKYSFAQEMDTANPPVATGNFKVTEPSSTGVAVTATALAAVEKTTKTDLNADGFYGLTIDAGLDTTGGLYKATAMGQQYLLVGSNLTSSANAPLDLTNALLGKDGKAWKPDNVASVTGTDNILRLVTKTTAGNNPVTTYDVYVKDDSTVDATHPAKFFKYSFDSTKTLTTGPVEQTALDMAAAEKAAPGRDLNNDGSFGVVFDSTFSAQGDVYKASLLGRTAYIVASPAPTTGTVGSAAKDFSGSLQTDDGKAWAVKDGYRVTGAVKTSADAATLVTYDVYAIKSSTVATVTTDETTDVIKYSFTADSGNYTVDAVTSAGVKVTAQQLAAVEKTKAANLNADTTFGVSIDKTLDNTGGLYVASALGNKFVIVGASNLISTPSNPQDLTKALLNMDGTAWSPDTPTAKGALDPMAATNTLKVVSTTTVGPPSTTTYDVYVKDATTVPLTPTYAKYSFGNDFKMTGNRVDMTTEQIASIEKTLRRDLTGDSKYGIDITAAVDSIGGLYKGSLGARADVYFADSPNLTPGSAVASQAIDFSKALLNVDGSYFNAATATAAGVTVLKSFTSGATGAERFNVIASITGDDTKLRQYTFSNVDGADKKLLPAESKDLSLIEIAALETSKTRDLNGDGVIGARVNQTAVDRVGGLFEASIVVNGTTKKFLSVAATADDAANTNLSKVLLNKDGTAWSNGSATSTVIKALGGSAGYDVYTQASTTYTQYHFDSTYTLDDSKTKTLNTVDLAAAEVSISRDINADNVLGARITKRIDTTAANFLSTATINSTEYVLAASTAPGNSEDLSTSLTAANGTAPWKLNNAAAGADFGYTLQRVKVNAASYEVYATNASGDARRFTFGADRVLQKTADLTKDLFAKAILTPTSGNYEDSVGGLYKANLLGNTFYVQGTAGGTGSAPDLSKALFVNGGAAWAPGTDYKIGGMVTTVTGGVKAYDVYTYKKDAGVVTDVKKDSWDTNLNYLGQTTADPAALVAVETTVASASLVGYGRDLNGDGVLGFKTTIATPLSTEASYKGVTTAIVGSIASPMTFLIAGKDMTSGNTVGTAVKLSDALLNAAGTAAWTPDNLYNITAVDSTGSSRFVYAVKTGTPDLVKKYEFDKTSGKSLGAGVTVSAVELAAAEKAYTSGSVTGADLNGDNTIGAVVVSKVTDADNLTRDLGLLKASVNGNQFYVYKAMPDAGAKIDLSKALLNQNGTAWAPPATGADAFTIKGTYSAGGDNDPVEVYGVNTTGAIQQFKFAKTYDAFGTPSTTYTVMASTSGTGTVNSMTGAQLATNEYADTKDLNGDGAIGYKVTVGAPIAVQTGATPTDSVGLGTASVSNGTGGTADQIYVAGTSYATIGTTAALSTSKFALKLDATNYWKLDSGYSIQSIIKTDGVGPALPTLDVYANNGSDKYLKYSFESATPGTTPWTLKATTIPTAWDMLTLEVSGSVKRDLNGDNFVGATAVTQVTDASNPTSDLGLIKAKLASGGNDLYVYSGMPAAGSYIDLTKALLNADGTNWNPPATTFRITGTKLDATVATAPVVEIYGVDTAVAGSALQQYRFAKSSNPFGASTNTFTLLPSTTAGANGANALTGAQVAALETAKDLNGDGVKGYKVSPTPLKVQTGADAATSFGLGTATAGNSTTDQIYIVGKDYSNIGTSTVGATSIANASLKLDPNTYWQPASGDSIKSIVVNTGSTTLDIYVTNSGANKKYSFTSTGAGAAPWTLAGTSAPSNWDMMTLEVSASIKRDLNGDNVIGVSASSLTKVTDASNPTQDLNLVKTNLGSLNSDLYVYTAMPSTGAYVDLTKALLNADGTNWNPPISTFKITATRLNAGVVEIYGLDTAAATSDLQQYRFANASNTLGAPSNAYALLPSVSAGTNGANSLTGAQVATLELASIDLNGDGVKGFKVNATPLNVQKGADAANSFGLGTAKSGNAAADQIYIVGKDYATIGTSGGISIANAALKLNSTTYWKPDSGDTIKSIDVNAGATTLDIYVTNGGANKKYSFTSTGAFAAPWSYAGTSAPSNWDIMTLEATRDLNGDNVVGAGASTVSKVTDALNPNPLNSVGLIKAHVSTGDVYVFSPDIPAVGTKIDLTKALLNQAGTDAWAPANNVRITGTFQAAADGSPIEVYGVDTSTGATNGKAMVFRFAKTINPLGTVGNNYTLMNAQVGSGTSQNLTGVDMVTKEVAIANGGKDLNGDGVIGFKVDAGSVAPLVAQTGANAAASYGMGTASVKNTNSSSDQIYFVGADYGKIGTTATGATSTASTALKLDTGEYWKPDSTYDIKSIVVNETSKTLDVYARLSSSANYSSAADYLKYSFSSMTIGTDNWVLSSVTTTPLTSVELLALELDPTGTGAAGGAASRDLNGDKAVGLMLDTVSSGVYTAHIDDKNYYIVSNDATSKKADNKLLATNVAESALNLGSVLYDSANTAWTPTTGSTASNWREATAAEITAGATRVNALTETTALGVKSYVYFDNTNTKI